MLFRVYACMYKFVQALVGEPRHAHLPVLDADAVVAAQQTAAKRRSDISLAQFTMAFRISDDL
jgi:hypothetical protein